MQMWNHYHVPATVDDTVRLLEQYAGAARIIAGGTDLLVEMRATQHPPYEALIDITRIADLRHIDDTGAALVIGAGVTHTQIAKSAEILVSATCLAESCGMIGGPQVRNVATLGGNVARALPAGDGTVSLVALDAQAESLVDGDMRRVPILEMYRGAGESLLAAGRDLLLRLVVEKHRMREGSAFSRIMRPQGVALPILGCAAWVRLDETCTRFEAARVCIAPSGPTPQRAAAVESALVGQDVGSAAVERAIAAAQESLKLRTSKYRATSAYRREMLAVLLRRVIPLAAQRAQQQVQAPAAS